MRYSVSWKTVGSVQVAVLQDAETRAEARVVPALGNTCVALRQGEWRVLDEPPDQEALCRRAWSYGIPILFPWPNRVRNARFTFEGREYRLPPSLGSSHANHGLVRTRPWHALRLEAEADGAMLESEIRSGDLAEVSGIYPSNFTLRVLHRLTAGRLEIEALVTNSGSGRLPFGYGLQPYFAVPLGSEGRRAGCELYVPADTTWELEDHLPTGRRRPVSGRLDLRQPRRLGSGTYDDVLTDLDRPFWASLSDPAADRTIDVGADDSFRECVVFAPLERPVVAIEPYTCTTDALNLQAQGIDAGLQVLEPGESWAGAVSIETDSLAD